MTATHMDTPVGPIRIREEVRLEMADMTDREIADRALGGRFIDPEFFAELLHRGLSGPGMYAHDTYRIIEGRENARLEELDAERAAILKARNESDCKRGIYRCAVCHENPVNPEDGYDTCSSCLSKI